VGADTDGFGLCGLWATGGGRGAARGRRRCRRAAAARPAARARLTPPLLPPTRPPRIKYYNNCLFHNVQKGFIAQTGDPTGTGRGGDSIWGCVAAERRARRAAWGPRCPARWRRGAEAKARKLAQAQRRTGSSRAAAADATSLPHPAPPHDVLPHPHP
jgi:hypothetical protein